MPTLNTKAGFCDEDVAGEIRFHEQDLRSPAI